MVRRHTQSMGIGFVVVVLAFSIALTPVAAGAWESWSGFDAYAAETSPDVKPRLESPRSGAETVDSPDPVSSAPETSSPTAAPVALPRTQSSTQTAGTPASKELSPKKEVSHFLPPAGVADEMGRNSVDRGALHKRALVTDPEVLAEAAKQAAEQRRAESVQTAVQEDLRRSSAFETAAEGFMPLSPEQIRELMSRLEKSQAAAAPPSTGQPQGVVQAHTMALDPGAEPAIVNVGAGYVTTIALLDASGQPWPIMDFGVGGNFEVSPTGAGSHVIRISPLTRFGTGNISVLLQDLPVPITFRLVSGGPKVDYRYDARIPKFGPKAKAPLIDRSTLITGDEVIMSVLENAPPREAKRMKISGVDGRNMAWKFGARIFLRTPLTLLSPSWKSSVSSGDGMTVYELAETPVLLLSDEGNLTRAYLSVEEDHATATASRTP
ncbi:MAG: hypothetical protein IPI58_04400 [Alphaproteobacteria bacterium]|nr:MAG: hypothetical protein IPI58_04400 [Alphaproteobacteria bacterium]